MSAKARYDSRWYCNLMSGNLSEVCALMRFTGVPSKTRRHRAIPWSWKTFMEEANGPTRRYDDSRDHGISDR